MKRALLIFALFALGLSSGASALERLAFDAAKDNDLSRLVVYLDDGKSDRQTVTDFQLDIITWSGSALEKLKAPNLQGRDPWKRGFTAAMQIVANGKLYRNAGGECSPWEKDISVCSIECDGGHFLLQRQLGPKFHKLTVILRPVPELLEADASSNIRIGECGGAEEEPTAVMLDVKSGREARLSFTRWAE